MSRERMDPRTRVRVLSRIAQTSTALDAHEWTEWRGETPDGRSVLIRYYDGKLSFGIGDDTAAARFSAAMSRPRCIGPVGEGLMNTERMLALMARQLVPEPEASFV